MSDETTPTAPTAAEIEVLQSSYARMKAERETLVTERDTFRRERDALATEAGTLKQERTALVAERDDFKNKYTTSDEARAGFANTIRERDVLDGLRTAFPGVEPATLRGAFLGQVEEKKVDRYPTEPAKVLPGLIELLKTSNPMFTRAAPVNGGGPPPKVETPTANSRSKNVFSIGAPEPPTP